jgi:hypothetical protein
VGKGYPSRGFLIKRLYNEIYWFLLKYIIIGLPTACITRVVDFRN